ncbi:SDR family oxidoreductase [Pararhodospirillum photometricum]|uniref:Short-chain dehydrogenase/reductase SDR n=1 Tax=Pararhodospirillum photometricum DSM 122 TaxID=1150469 RepID=H6SMA4_PARPM|nr:SDR family oxidoreductase [Pararhodospirillum photometricum]CCG06787.1 Short-chain dehydrogenase/reductase SDR [Pararhodospirillum photometricum DSM 122]
MPTVLITGANRGLGLEFARQYKAAGWDVIATCRDPIGADALGALGVEELALDVAEPGAIPVFASRLEGRPLDLLVCNAGVYGGAQALTEVDIAAWEHTFRVNTIAPLKLTEALLPNLRLAPGAKAVYVSSLMASMTENTSGGEYIYRSSKAALNAVVKSLSLDLRADGITVAALHPGWVRTDMGGPNGMIDAPESVTGLRRVIDGLTPADSGRFLAYTGANVPW